MFNAPFWKIPPMGDWVHLINVQYIAYLNDERLLILFCVNSFPKTKMLLKAARDVHYNTVL